jgi:selenocysteine lyase/cysteine desulfurase
VPNDDSGSLDVAALENMIDERTALIAITWVPTNGGLVNPAAEIGRIANKAGVPYLLDACQAIGQMPVDVVELGCDFLSATGRKFLRAPRGTGFLYVREKLIKGIEPVVIDYYAARWVAPDRYELRDDARRFENWENAYALRAGLGVAAQYATDLGLENIQDRAWGLAARLREQLADISSVSIYDIGAEKSATVSFLFEGQNSQEVVANLRKQNICIGLVSPDGTLLDSEARKLPGLLRAAPHYYNTEVELDELVDRLGDLVRN